MVSITVAIPDERMKELGERAERLNLSVEDLVRATIDELLDRPDDAFERAAKRILEKNSELYRRLA